MSEGQLHFEKDGAVARITFDNPTQYNALTWRMWRELGEYCAQIAKDRDIRAVTFRGAGGKAFISGTDISGFVDFKTGQQGVEYEREVGSYVEAVEKLPQPTVAVVEGWAVGGGLGIAFACDFRVATPGSRFGSPIGRTIGNCLAAKSYARFLAHIGPTLAKRMLLAGEVILAEELKSLGLVYDVVEKDALDEAVTALCDKLIENAPLTIQATKEAIRRITYASLPDIDDLISMVYASDDFKMGVRNFVEKTKVKPAWTGK